MVPSAILLEGMRFHARHGVYAEESSTGHWFTVDVRIAYPTMKAGASDQLADTLDYQRVYQICAEVMQTPSRLLEHLAWAIITEIGKLAPDTGLITVKVAKENPPFGGPCDRVAIEISGKGSKTEG